MVLAFYEYLKLQNKIDSIFLIGPKNCYLSWKREFKLNLNRDPKLKILDENKIIRKKIYEGEVEVKSLLAISQLFPMIYLI